MSFHTKTRNLFKIFRSEKGNYRTPLLCFFTPHIVANKRCGPHNFETLSFLYGAMLSDAHAEVHGHGVRITFHHSTKQIEFFSWIKAFLAERGYCSSKLSKVTK
jgi:hypothetical protein